MTANRLCWERQQNQNKNIKERIKSNFSYHKTCQELHLKRSINPATLFAKRKKRTKGYLLSDEFIFQVISVCTFCSYLLIRRHGLNVKHYSSKSKCILINRIFFNSYLCLNMSASPEESILFPFIKCFSKNSQMFLLIFSNLRTCYKIDNN